MNPPASIPSAALRQAKLVAAVSALRGGDRWGRVGHSVFAWWLTRARPRAMVEEMQISAMNITTFRALAKATAIFAVVATSSAASAATIFTFPNTNESPNPLTQTSLSFTSGGISLTIDNPVGGPFPSTGGVSSTSQGLCVYAINGGSQTRCGYASSPADSTTKLTGLSLTFSSDINLKSFNVSQFVNLSSGSLQFGTSPAINFTAIGNQSLPDIFVEANTPINLISSGTLSGSNVSGVYRLSTLTVEQVPGPLPLLGGAAAFAYSRRLRKKIKFN